jgi:hypothetical protein
MVQLTEEQVEVAETLGCRFVEASEAQVRQFSMQRRVFQIAGKAYLATRADGFYETAGTLAALIAQAMEQPKVPMPDPEASGAVAEAEEPKLDQEALSAEPALDEAEVPGEPAVAAAAPPALPVEAVAQEAAAPALAVPGAVARTPKPVLSAMTTIAEGYMRGHAVDAAQLSTLLVTVHRTLAGLAGIRRRSASADPG